VGQFLTPRGRFAIEMYPTHLRMLGKSVEFKVAYKSIARMFYLGKPSPTGDEASKYYFVISLDDPLRHGSQRYAHLVMHLDRRHLSVPLNVSDEDIRAGRYGGLGRDSLVVEGDLPKTVASLFKNITEKSVFRAGSFKSARSGAGAESIKASLKSNDGALYFMEKSLMFLHKPALWLRYSDVELATARRATGASRTWELVLAVRPGTALPAGAASGRGGAEVAFQALDIAEIAAVTDFLAAHGVAVEKERHGGGAVRDEGGGGGGGEGEEEEEEDEDEEDDDDYQAPEESDASGAKGGAKVSDAAVAAGSSAAGCFAKVHPPPPSSLCAAQAQDARRGGRRQEARRGRRHGRRGGRCAAVGRALA
jgi:structure-specific recognition protein 1